MLTLQADFLDSLVLHTCHIADHGKYDESREETRQAVHTARDDGVSAGQNTQLMRRELLSCTRRRCSKKYWGKFIDVDGWCIQFDKMHHLYI
jgi:hypothetical protein